MKRKDIVKAAKELNEILGLDPQIDTKQDLNVVKKLIMKASDLLEPEDKITKATKTVIAGIKEEMESAEPPEDKEEETSDTAPPATQDEDSDSDEEPPAKPESKKGKKSRQKTETTADSTPPAPKKNTKTVTKKSVILELLKSKKGATIEQMAQAIVDRGIDADYDKNCRVVKAHLQKMGFDTKKASIEANPIFKEV
jgi:hypothetical protein